MSVYRLYIIRCADGSLYTGITVDVERRLQQHESGKGGARYLRGRGPLQLVYDRAVGDRSRASRLEIRVKRLRRREKLHLIAGRLSLESLFDEDQVSVSSTVAKTAIGSLNTGR
ncbi:MAG: GIY-YIG nuclease family protein [Pseudomonadota bacterium]